MIARYAFQPSTGFNSQPPEGGWVRIYRSPSQRSRFNSQPPEGGWVLGGLCRCAQPSFQLTAARRRLAVACYTLDDVAKVSTHSRPKAAGTTRGQPYVKEIVSTHSRPKAAGLAKNDYGDMSAVSTHSRPKAAGRYNYLH